MAQIRNEALLKQIAQQIQQLRLARNITQEVFYNDTNIHIARIEAGQANITVSTLENICSYLGISMSAFFSNIEQSQE